MNLRKNWIIVFGGGFLVLAFGAAMFGLVKSFFDEDQDQPQAQIVAAPSEELNPDTMSIGKKLFVVDIEELLPESDSRVVKANGQIAAIAERFGMPEERVADQALISARIIREETGGQELITDTLDSALVATMGLDDPGDLSTVLAIYATSRTSGSDPDVAKRVTYAFLHVDESALK